MQRTVPVDWKKLHPSDLLIFLGFLKMCLEQVQGNTSKIINYHIEQCFENEDRKLGQSHGLQTLSDLFVTVPHSEYQQGCSRRLFLLILADLAQWMLNPIHQTLQLAGNAP